MFRRGWAPAIGLALLATLWVTGARTAHAVPLGQWLGGALPPDPLSVNGEVVLLADGTPLLFGLETGAVEQYHPDTGTWTRRGLLKIVRGTASTATRLPSNVVLLAGGLATEAELFDPATNTSALTGSLHVHRANHQATLLASGRVLVSGGNNTQPVGTTEVFDPGTGAWTVVGALNQARWRHAAVRLSDGRVLVAGGMGVAGPLASAEIYDPATGTWTVASAMDRVRSNAAAGVLVDGRILVTGDFSSQVYDPATNAWTPSVSIPGQGFGIPSTISALVQSHQLVVLNDGTPLHVSLASFVVCKFGCLPSGALTSALLDLDTGQWTPAADGVLGQRSGSAATLADGRVLLSGAPGVLLFVPARIVPSPSTIDFGRTNQSAPVDKTVTLQNTGIVTLTGTATTPAPFSVVSGQAFSIPPGGTVALTVRFTPAGFGAAVGTLQIASNSNHLGLPMTGAVGVQVSGRVTSTSGFGVGGLTFTVSGAFNGQAVSDANGDYRFFVPPNNGYNVAPASPTPTLTPATRNVIVGTQDVGGLDFVAAVVPSRLGVFRNGSWSLDLSGNRGWDGCSVDACLGFGLPGGDLPVAGDWSGTGRSEIGVFRDGIWSLDVNGNGQWDGCAVDDCPVFGTAGDDPVVGDWIASGATRIGVFRRGLWFLDLDGNGHWDGCGTDGCFAFGLDGDLPVAGDWTGSGAARIGVFRQGLWFLDLNGNGAWDGCEVDACFVFGQPGDLPAVGDWAGTGHARIGVYRAGVWFLDLNGNGRWDGCAVDACVSFGLPGDDPVVGSW